MIGLRTDNLDLIRYVELFEDDDNFPWVRPGGLESVRGLPSLSV